MTSLGHGRRVEALDDREGGGSFLPWILGAIGAIAGLVCWFLLDDGGDIVPWRAGAAAFIGFGSLALGFTLVERERPATLVFALLVGLVPGGIAFHVVRSGERLAEPQYVFAAGVLACGLAVPLFQAGFHRLRLATPYRLVHFHVWADAVSGGGAGLFALLAFALLWLTHGLLSLAGIDSIETLIQQGWLPAVWLAGAFGAALGVLRNNIAIIGALRSVALLVLALLAVPLALALLVFLAALIASGGGALWEATDSATPVLLACAAGCFVLANAVIGDDDAGRSGNMVMLVSALVLALGILPLAVFAAISMGVRIGQHGLAPERLWGLVAVVVAVAWGLAYWVAVIRGRRAAWCERLRAANLHLAAGLCVLALLLALPVLDFGAIAARNQVARLARGAVSAEDFDYAALRWDFGEGGLRALAQLGEGTGKASRLAREAWAQPSRPFAPSPSQRDRESEAARLRIENGNPELDRQLRDFVMANPWHCSDQGCRALVAGRIEVAGGGTHVVLIGNGNINHLLVLPDGGVRDLAIDDGALAMPEAIAREAPDNAIAGVIEIRPYAGRQLHRDGKPVGEPFR